MLIKIKPVSGEEFLINTDHIRYVEKATYIKDRYYLSTTSPSGVRSIEIDKSEMQKIYDALNVTPENRL